MAVQDLIAALTNKSGVVAALAALLGVVGGFLGIVRPWLQRRRERKESKPVLQFTKARIEDPPPWSEAGRATFELMNSGGGRAVMSDLLLTVIECGPTEEPKMVESAAPVPEFTYKVTLMPNVKEYDVRKREFGSEGPHSFDKQEVEAFVVELRSTEAQWYRLQFVVCWYDVKRPRDVMEVRCEPLRIEFKPDVADLLG